MLYTLWLMLSTLKDVSKYLRRITLLLDESLIEEKRQTELLVEISKSLTLPEGSAVRLELSAQPPTEQS